MKYLRDGILTQYFFLTILSSLMLGFNFFYPSPVLSLVVLVFLLIIYHVTDLPKISRGYSCIIVTGILFLLLFQTSQLLYAEWKFYVYILTSCLGIVLVLTLVRETVINEKKLTLLVMSIMLAIGVFVVKVSPRPRIDVYEVLNRSSKLLIGGESPYYNAKSMADEEYYQKNNMKELYNIYKQPGVSGVFLPYSPLIIFSAGFGAILGDVRYASVLYMALITLGCFYLVRGSSNLRPLLFGLSITSPFLIEQAWTETLLIFLFVMILLSIQSNKLKTCSFLIGLTCLAKLYMLPLVFFYFVGLYFNKSIKVFLKNGVIFFIGLVLPFAIMALWGREEIWHFLTVDMWFFNDYSYPFLNSVLNQFERLTDIKIYFLSKYILAFVSGYFLFFEKNKNPMNCMKYFVISIFSYFVMNKTFFYNYAWAVVVMILILSSVWVPFKKISFTNIFYIVSRAFILISMPIILTDIWRYTQVAEQVLIGKTPYLDFVFEYPPLALIQIMVPGWITHFSGTMTFGFYRFLFMGLSLTADYYFFSQLKAKDASRANYYTLATLMMAPFLLERLDLVMMWFVIISIKKTIQGKHLQATAFTILGGWYKIIPFVSSFVIFKKTPEKKKFIYIIVFANAIIVTLLSFVFQSKTLSFLDYHSKRPFQIESFGASVVMFFGKFLPIPYEVVSSFGSKNVIFPFSEMFLMLNKIALASMIVLLVTMYFKEKIGSSGFMSLLFFTIVTFSSVFSTQYLIWILIPFLFSEVYDAFKMRDKKIFLFICFLSLIIFVNYRHIISGDFFYVTILFVRNALLVWLTTMSFTKYFILHQKVLSQFNIENDSIYQ